MDRIFIRFLNKYILTPLTEGDALCSIHWKKAMLEAEILL